MPRDPALYLEDIVEACGRIRDYVKGMTVEEFERDTKTVDAVVRNLEVIGEATRTLPDEVKSMAEEVEWRKIAGLRNILIHEYFGVNLAILWDIVENKVAPLGASCRRILDALADPEGSDTEAT